MSFDIVAAHEAVCRVVRSLPGVKEGMLELSDYCEAVSPSPVWQRVRELDFQGDADRLTKWLAAVLSSEPAEDEINAFYFGLFNPILGDNATSGMYVSGSTRFDPEDETGDWACWDDSSYLPAGRYADSQILHEIYRLTNRSGVGEVGEYVLCFGYACLAVAAACMRVEPGLLLGTRASRAVAVGFDSGDLLVLGHVTRGGWQSGVPG